jgi:hypothetical protein
MTTGKIHKNRLPKFRGFSVHVPFLWVEGMALFPFILSRRSSCSKIFLNHECIHLRQQIEMGLVLFYIWYLAEYVVRLIEFRNHALAYYNISFEREAYQNEGNADYLLRRSFWAFLKYMRKNK